MIYMGEMNIMGKIRDLMDALLGEKRKRETAVAEISRAYEDKFEEYHEQKERETKELYKVINDVNMQMRNYDQLMEMNHGENYIDPVTGKIDEKEKFNRNREIYKENLRDTGMPF